MRNEKARTPCGDLRLILHSAFIILHSPRRPHVRRRRHRPHRTVPQDGQRRPRQRAGPLLARRARCSTPASSPTPSRAFDRALAINPNLSKAYQLAATALLKLDRRDAAVARLTEGVKVADARGDVMPRGEMVRMLQDLAAPVPELASSKQAPAPVGEGQVQCKRCGKVKPRLPSPPMRDALGQDVYAHVCPDCWRDAIGQGHEGHQRAPPARSTTPRPTRSGTSTSGSS
jgi:hypothetical protein